MHPDFVMSLGSLSRSAFSRIWCYRLRSWIHPSNPGITAAEALTAPFFTKRISLRGVIHGCSTRYSRWTKASRRDMRDKTNNSRPKREVVKKSRADVDVMPERPR